LDPQAITSGLSAQRSSLATDSNEGATEEITAAELENKEQNVSCCPQPPLTPAHARSTQVRHTLVQSLQKHWTEFFQSLQKQVTENFAMVFTRFWDSSC